MTGKWITPLLLVLAATLCACTTTTTSTTPRTAVEIALLTEAAEATIAQVDPDLLYYYERFLIDTAEFDAYEKSYIINALRRRFLEHGMHVVNERSQADLIIYPRSGVSALDESRVFIGIPAIPLPIPSVDGAGGFASTPEIALYKKDTQISRSRLGLYGIDRQSGTMAFDLGILASQRYYTRWTFFGLIGFRTTDLGPPYRRREMN